MPRGKAAYCVSAQAISLIRYLIFPLPDLLSLSTTKTTKRHLAPLPPGFRDVIAPLIDLDVQYCISSGGAQHHNSVVACATPLHEPERAHHARTDGLDFDIVRTYYHRYLSIVMSCWRMI